MNNLINWIPGYKKIQGDGAKTLNPEDLIEPDFVGNATADLPNQITEIITCSACSQEKPPEVNHMDWMRLSVGMTRTGRIQIWCLRHNRNVTLFTRRE